ncbi:MAG: hypothetical protein LM517_02055 [Nitrosomonas sp.]|nr:hypothetical protein [Nitrosomonas sp.]
MPIFFPIKPCTALPAFPWARSLPNDLIGSTAPTPTTAPNLKESAIMLSSQPSGNKVSARNSPSLIAPKLTVKLNESSTH